MTTIKVKLRTSTVSEKSGTVYYQLIHRSKVQQVTTSMHLLPSDWDVSNARPELAAVCGAAFNGRIEGDIALMHRIISQLDRTGEDYSVSDVVRQFKSKDSFVFAFDYMKMQIVQLRISGKYGTARNYEKALNSFSCFLDGVDIPLSSFNEELVEGYNTFLRERNIVRNSISFYMRIWRAVYNKAARCHHLEQNNPFSGVYTGVDRTGKRAINKELISIINKLDLSKSASLDIARDIFIFSYCMRGMSFVDIAYLKKSNIRNGMISYIRHKTCQQLSVHIEPRIRQILDKYSKAVSESSYVFPILKDQAPEANYNRYRIALNTYNNMLHKLETMLPVKCRLTSYTARHSWARIARS